KALVQTNTLQDYVLGLLTSAVTLSLWRNFDSRKFDVLFELTASSSDLVRQRAYVGILIAIYVYSDRLSFFSSILARFYILSDNKGFTKSLESIIMQFIRSKESEKIAKRFSEEIIPEMAKITPQMRDKLNMIHGENDPSEDEEKNPDWQELLDEVPGLTDKMKEISEMQMEGADVFLSTFSMLKDFPFFNTIHNWLVPFNVEYPEIAEETLKDENHTFVKAIGKSHFLCNSDKYSFMFSMQQLPEAQKRQMASTMGAEFEGMKDIEKDATSLNNSRTSEFISNQYVQDLYRLFNIHPRKGDFDNIFRKRLDFHNKSSIAQLIEDPKVWHNVAEYYFAKNHFDEAAELYDSFLDTDSANTEVLQKRGYCAQKKGDYKTALKFYLKADLVESDNSWTIKKIAYCYRAFDDAENALKFYKQAIVLQPKNYALQLSLGHCYLSLKNYDDALNSYFKIELASSKPQRVWRPIAWSSFICNKLDQSKKYYKKILDHKPTAHDYINAGHTELASQNNQQALNYYKQAVQGLNDDLDKFLSIFEEDTSYILSYGVEESDLPILLDSLRYNLEY
nr:tetratricopeptide repeat protein [Bacteroidales bacterium]